MLFQSRSEKSLINFYNNHFYNNLKLYSSLWDGLQSGIEEDDKRF